MQHEIFGVRERNEAYAKATAAAERAVTVARPAGEGHSALAHILGHHGKLKAAEAEARLALESNPGAAIGHAWLGWILTWTGRFPEAERELRRAIELDPLSGPYQSLLGHHLLSAGRPAEALKAIGRAHELGYRNSWTVTIEALALIRLGRLEDAMAAIDRARDLPEAEETLQIARATVHAAAGRKTEAERLLAAAEKEFRPSRSEEYAFIPLAYLAMGEREAAVAWFQKLGRAGEEGLGWARFFPEVQPLLPDPRMQAILRSGGYLD